MGWISIRIKKKYFVFTQNQEIVDQKDQKEAIRTVHQAFKQTSNNNNHSPPHNEWY